MATNNTNDGGKTAPLDPQIADRLLDLLSTDDAFRELFSSDPQAALAQVGYRPEPLKSATGIAPDASTAGLKTVDGCCTVKALASKEAIVQARDAIRAMLLAGMAQTPPQLDAGPSDDRRTLK
jgi:putative modified peptide